MTNKTETSSLSDLTDSLRINLGEGEDPSQADIDGAVGALERLEHYNRTRRYRVSFKNSLGALTDLLERFTDPKQDDEMSATLVSVVVTNRVPGAEDVSTDYDSTGILTVDFPTHKGAAGFLVTALGLWDGTFEDYEVAEVWG